MTARPPARRRRPRDAGSLTLEFVVLAPALLALAAAMIAAGRITLADGAVAAAAKDAARHASLARDPAQARERARSSALAALQRQGLPCQPRVRVDTSGFARPLGQPATVTAHVACTVALSDLAAVPGLPGTTTRRANFTSPLAPYRAR